MTLAKKLGIRLATAVFAISILGLAVSTATNSVFSTPDKLKESLREGRVYDAVANGIVTEAVANAETKSDLPLDNPLAQQAAKAAITPALIQENGEKIIDGTYSWLEGETKTPEFKLDTAHIKQQVATNVSNASLSHIQTLPPCTAAQMQQIDTSAVDLFSLTCRPQGIDLAALRDQYAQQITASDQFLQDSNVTAQDVKNNEGQNVFAEAKRVPQAFQLGLVLPWIFGILAILSGAGVVLLHETRSRGIKTTAITLLVVGILLIVATFVTSFILGLFKPSIEAAEAVAIQEAVVSVMKSLSGLLNSVLLKFGIAYLVVGAGGLISLRFRQQQTQTAQPLDTPPTKLSEAQNPEPPKPPRDNKPKDI